MSTEYKCRATRVLEMYKETPAEKQIRDLHIEVDNLHSHVSSLMCHLYELTPKSLDIDAFMFDDPKRQLADLDGYLKSRLSANGDSSFGIEGREHTWSVNFYPRSRDLFEYSTLYTLYRCMHRSPFVLTGHQLDHENDGSQTLKIWFTK